jgi:MSHA type pilus biogenesis protein MshL
MEGWNVIGAVRQRGLLAHGLWLAMGLLLGLSATAFAAGANGDDGVPAWDINRPKVSIVTNGWVEVRDILQSVSANAGLGLQMAPDVGGQVNVHLENVTVSRALEALLTPADLGYEVIDDVLVVYGRSLVSRWFTFDYPVTEREGRGELAVSVSQNAAGGASSSGGSSGSGGSGESQNKSHVTSTAVMAIWPGVMSALETIVFAGTSSEDISGRSGGENRSINLADNTGRTLVVNPMASLVQVTAEWERVQKVEQLLARLKESLQRQVAIEVRIMEVTLDDATQTGVNWETLFKSDASSQLQTFSSTTNLAEEFFQFKVDSRRIKGVLQAIASTGNLRTVSTPRVTTLNNQKAIVRVVREEVYYLASVEPAIVANGVATEPVINYTPQTVPVGVVLDVTPQVGRDRVITLNVHPTISDVVGVAVSPNEDTAPILSVRELDTVGKVSDGETLIIAGFISERKRDVRSGVPILKDLPLLGYLFGKTESETYNIELIMLLTPVIMEGSGADAVALAARQAMESRLD